MSKQQRDQLDAILRQGRLVPDVPVTLEATSGVPHMFQSFGAVLDEAGAALDRASDFPKKHFAGRSVPGDQGSGRRGTG